MGLAEVSSILWRERNLLDLLLFKLEEERLVMNAGLGRWRARATHEVELVLGELQLIEAPRTAAVDVVAAEMGLGPGCSLEELAAAAPPPWDGLLAQHREAFALAMCEIGPLEVVHRTLLGQSDTEAAMAWLEGPEGAWPVRAEAGNVRAETTLRLLPDQG